jgi:hypothetical protein
MSESLSKLTDYVALSPGAALTKLSFGTVLSPGLALAKLNSFAALGSGLTISKQVTYAVLTLPEPTPDTFGPIPIFPDLPESFPIKLSIVMDTVIGTSKSLREVRVAQQTLPLWDIEIPFQELRDKTQNQTPFEPFVYPVEYEQYEELVQLWLMMYGRSGVFGFNCPWDNSRLNQQIAVGDGSTYTFTIVRTWGSGLIASLLPIGLIGEVISVQVNNVTIPPTHYSVDRNKISFVDDKGNTYPPGLGDPIVMTFTFYYLCRFTEDEQDFEEFSKNRWTVPSLKFRAVNWP